MDIATIIREVVETINLIPALSDVLVVEDGKGYVDDETRMKISQRSVYAVVGWSSFTPQIQGETAPNGDLIGNVTIVVSIFEKPAVNRATLGAITCQDIAMSVARELHGASADGMDAPLFLRSITPVSKAVSSPDGSVVTCDVEFTAKTSL